MNMMPILAMGESAGIRHNIAQFCQAATATAAATGAPAAVARLKGALALVAEPPASFVA
jgi:hypothetical protein